MISAKFLYYRSKKYKEKCEDLKLDRTCLKEVLNEELQKINTKQGATVPGLPMKYHTTDALGFMQEYVKCGVSTLKELIQMYEEHSHRERMESMQDRLLYEAQEQSDRLNQLESQLNYIKYYK